jgi:hypothetical protein
MAGFGVEIRFNDKMAEAERDAAREAKATAAEAVPHLEKNMDAASPLLASARAIASS